MKQRTKLGVIVSVLWLGGIATYVSLGKGWAVFATMELNSFGDLCAGVFAPLAFLWLVIGYAQQGEELAHNVEALRRQANETANLVAQAQVQAEAIKANELHARRDTFLRFADNWTSKLNYLAIDILVGADVGYVQTKLWERIAEGNTAGILQSLIHQIKNNTERFRGLNASKRQNELIQQYFDDFIYLIGEAEKADTTGQLSRLYEYGFLGNIYAGLCFANHRSAEFKSRPPITGLDQI